jgi:N-acetylmuramoyl-L-alanine amidase CwlA
LYEDIVELDFRVKLVNTLLTNVDSDQESSARGYLNEIIDKMYSEYGYQLEQKYTETKFKEAFDKINDKFEVYIPFQNSTGFAFGIVQNISPNTTQIDELKNLYDGVNSGSNDTFNGKENFV